MGQSAVPSEEVCSKKEPGRHLLVTVGKKNVTMPWQAIGAGMQGDHRARGAA
jgi:hypothetical protein